MEGSGWIPCPQCHICHAWQAGFWGHQLYMQAEIAGHHGRQRAYYRRLIKLTPYLARRAVRAKNFIYHLERSARIYEINARKYFERPLIKAGEQLPEGVKKVLNWFIEE